MQLRHYLAILRRSWLLLVLLPLAVGGISLAFELQQPQLYRASTRLFVSQEPYSLMREDDLLDLNLQYSWISSEFVLDDVPQLVNSRVFAEDISMWLAPRGVEVAPEVVHGRLQAEVMHRAVTISAIAGDPALAEALVDAAAEVLEDNGLEYWDRTAYEDGVNGLRVAVLDPVASAVPMNTTRQLIIDVALRIVLALVAAVGLAFLIAYIDDTIHDRHHVEQGLGLPVVGVIPKE
jgi:capsular polysaccharide biosynthesis protein